ncbi:LysM domain-containing protein-like protein 5 [Colletotrichum truncatum]|uniref:LysM domain-containing protein-like protein 5 n=1 Tax=Colletotrichum truncatum TaxID=5467 RepID=A0ACC3Z1X5_COLTU|nr:LysM domain-containing protein-like protein 5 [Colletotrichum truncatum]KAF6781357.1 LysM domain-containing protein-like protein 5 [Colletotrichum truncatum]
MLRLSVFTAVGILAAQSAAASVKRFDRLAPRRFDSSVPFYDHDSNTPSDCTVWWNTDDGLSCDTVLTISGITIGQLSAMNPSTKSCNDWKTDYSYCVNTASGVPDPAPAPNPVTTSTPPTTTSTPTNPGNGVITPEPAQPGMVDNCNRFYQVQNGDTCSTIASKAGVSISQLTTWNTQIGGAACTGLWAGYNICTGVIGGSPTQPGPTINPTPQPVQDGMVDNCNRFHQVQSGDTCAVIASKAGVTVAQLAEWNKGIGGTACTGMWAGYYLCTGVAGGSPTQPGPTTNPTPQPIQDGMVNNCNRWHLVKSGDTCGTIASQTGVTVSQLADWNKGIGGTACTGMWAGYYLCTGVAGGSPTQPGPTANPTPQPVQDGMVGNCKKFHFVSPGQNCDTISRQYGISVGDFIRWNPAAGATCTGLWANTYACVGL